MVLYGMDAELQAKVDAKYDHELEQQVAHWIQEIIGEEMVEGLTFAEWLNDGKVLCTLINSIKPGTIKKINKMKAPFKKMENIQRFTDAARAIGVPESSMFATPDLYEEKNMGSVVNCIYTLACVVQTAVPEFSGPKLGTAMAACKEPARKKQMATQTGGLAGSIEQSQAYSPRGVAPMLHTSAGPGKAPVKEAPVKETRQEVTAPVPADADAAKKQTREVAPTRAKGGCIASAGEDAEPNRDIAEHGSPEGGAPKELEASEVADVQGLDADLKKTMAQKFDPELDRKVCAWIESVTGESRGQVTTAEWLRNGQVLCALGNAIRPGSIQGVSKTAAPFSQMENIKKFLGMARGLGMAEFSLFSTPDLYEEKNMGIVVIALNAFAERVQKGEGYSGPALDVAVKAEG